jgi:hypothetical protein
MSDVLGQSCHALPGISNGQSVPEADLVVTIAQLLLDQAFPGFSSGLILMSLAKRA